MNFQTHAAPDSSFHTKQIPTSIDRQNLDCLLAGTEPGAQPLADTSIRPPSSASILGTKMDSNGVHPMVLPRFVSNALYIPDLDPTLVTEDLLFNLFKQVGTVLSIRLCTNSKSFGDSSLPCHGYVNFSTIKEACLAWQTFNYKDLNGTPMHIMFSNLDPASRYNLSANIIIKNLEESIDSEALHHTFSTFGVVISSKVKRDKSGDSMGYGFIQFQDEEDAQRAIRLVNGKLLKGKQVYVGPFIPRSVDRLEARMNLNPLDLNPSYNTSVSIEIGEFGPINEVHVSNMSNTSGSSNYIIYNTSDDDEGSGSEVDDENSSLDNNDDEDEATIIQAKARAADMIKAARDAIIAEKRAAMPHIDPSYVPSSEPWAPQPWSAETLRANLASAHLPEERLAMLGGTLLPLVWKYTDSFSSDVTNELVKMEIEGIVHLIESAEALCEKVEATKKIILKRIQNQAPFVPKTPPAPASAPADHEAPALAQVQDTGEDPIPAVLAVALQPSQIGTGVFQLGQSSNVRKGTGFFDVSRIQQV